MHVLTFLKVKKQLDNKNDLNFDERKLSIIMILKKKNIVFNESKKIYINKTLNVTHEKNNEFNFYETKTFFLFHSSSAQKKFNDN